MPPKIVEPAHVAAMMKALQEQGRKLQEMQKWLIGVMDGSDAVSLGGSTTLGGRILPVDPFIDSRIASSPAPHDEEKSQPSDAAGEPSQPRGRQPHLTPDPPSPPSKRSAPPHASPALARTGSQAVVRRCTGCPDFGCVLEWRRTCHLTAQVDEAWLRGHNLIHNPVCMVHGGGDHWLRDGKVWECSKRSATSDNACRQTSAVCWPLVTQHSRLTAEQIVSAVGKIADGASASKISRELNVNRKTVEAITYRIGRCCHLYTTGKLALFTRCQVDETFVGKRKSGKGKKARWRGFWFITVTEERGGAGGGAGRTAWHLVKKRDKGTCEKIVRQHLVGKRSVVSTDAWKGYVTLPSHCRHKVVNHSIGFRSSDGTHTNIAEGIHGAIKRSVLEQHHRYGVGSRQLRRNIALACVKYGAGGGKTQEETWACRLQSLLIAVRDAYDAGWTHDNDDLETISSTTAASSDVNDPGCRIDIRLTKQGRIDQRCLPRQVDDAEEPVAKKQRREHHKPHATKHQKPPLANLTRATITKRSDKPYPLGRVDWKGQSAERMPGEEQLDDSQVVMLRWGAQQGRGGEALDTLARDTALRGVWSEDEHTARLGLRPGGLIMSVVLRSVVSRIFSRDVTPAARGWVIVDAEEGYTWMYPQGEPVATSVLKKKLPVTKLVLWPLFFAQHWVLAVIDRVGGRFDVLDSCAGYAVSIRSKAVDKVEALLRRAWGVQIKGVVKQHAPQQEPGSNDCGLFTIRNILEAAANTFHRKLSDEQIAGITREWLVKCWEDRANDTLPLLVPLPKQKKIDKASKKSASKAAKKPAPATKSVKRESRGPTPGM